jgi:hypothetical protein
MTNDMQLAISANGADFIPMALKKTAAEKRALRKPAVPVPVKKMTNFGKLPLGISQIDHLFLGSARDAHSQEQLQEFGVTHILNVAREINSEKFPGIEYSQENMDDEDIYPLEGHFSGAFEFIDKAKRVLVHCAVGKSRSPAILIAYLMYKGSNLRDAYFKVKSARQIAINSGSFFLPPP